VNDATMRIITEDPAVGQAGANKGGKMYCCFLGHARMPADW